jgi:hypothetical protein
MIITIVIFGFDGILKGHKENFEQIKGFGDMKYCKLTGGPLRLRPIFSWAGYTHPYANIHMVRRLYKKKYPPINGFAYLDLAL